MYLSCAVYDAGNAGVPGAGREDFSDMVAQEMAKKKQKMDKDKDRRALFIVWRPSYLMCLYLVFLKPFRQQALLSLSSSPFVFSAVLSSLP